MYKDVWKIAKKILSVILSVALIIGVVEIAPKVKAEESNGGTKSVQVRLEGGGDTTKTLQYTYGKTSFTYDGQSHCPELTSADLDNIGNVKDEFEFIVKKDGNIVGENEQKNAGNYTCYLRGKDGSGYTVTEEQVISYTIYQINSDNISRLKVTHDEYVFLNGTGVTPAITKVTAVLNDGSEIPVREDEYTCSALTETGVKDCTITLRGGDGCNFTQDRTETISCTVAYDLGTKGDYYVDFAGDTSTKYTGVPVNPDLRIFKTADSSEHANITTEKFDITYTRTSDSKSFRQIQDVGTYKVTITPKNGAKTCNVNGILFGGTYESETYYTIEKGNLDNLKVFCKNPNGDGDIELTGNKMLSVSYTDGTPVGPTGVYVKDASGNPIPCGEPEYCEAQDVGNAYMLIPLLNTNYEKIRVDYFIASKLHISEPEVTFPGENKEGVKELKYNGKAQLPSVLHVYNATGKQLTKDTHYKVMYSYQHSNDDWSEELTENEAAGSDEMADVGTKRIIIHGINGYAGQPCEPMEYTILAVNWDLEDSEEQFEIKLAQDNFYYDGNEKRPDVTVTLKDSPTGGSVPPEEYEVTYSNNVDAGIKTAKVKVAGTGSHYTGSIETTFTIKPLELKNPHVASPDALIYNGKGILPDIQIVEDGYSYIMKKGDDYEIVTITDDKGNVFENNQLPTNAGTYHVTIRNINASNIKNYPTGVDTKEIDYEIKPAPIDNLGFTLQGVTDNKIEWNGGETKPEIIGTNLIKDTDFTCEYFNADRVSVDTDASITITGIGNYTGTKVLTYKITPRRFTTVSGGGFTFGATKETNGMPYTFKLDVTDDKRLSGDKDLKLGTDYEVKELLYYNDAEQEWQVVTGSGVMSYTVDNATNQIRGIQRAGRYKIKIQGIGSYVGDQVTNEITCGTDISDKYLVHVDPENNLFTYNGLSQTPSAISLLNLDGTPSGIPTDAFTVSFVRTDNNRNNPTADVGRIYVIATGNPEKGYYGKTSISEERDAYYEIEAPVWRSEKFRITIETGGGITYDPDYAISDIPDVKVEFEIRLNEWIELKKGTDYTLNWDSEGFDKNTLLTAGPKTVSVTGEGNYKHEKNVNKKAGYTVAQVSIAEDNPDVTVEYNESSSFADGNPAFTLSYKGYQLLPTVDNADIKDYTCVISGSGLVYNPSNQKYEATYILAGKGNYTGTREVTVAVTKTNFSTAIFADSQEKALPGQFYVVWDESELLIKDANQPQNQRQQIKPGRFAVMYKPLGGGDAIPLEKGKHYTIPDDGYGANNAPGKNGSSNYVTISGMGGYVGDKQLFCELYMDIDKSEFAEGSPITSGGAIESKIFLEAGSNLESLVKLLYDSGSGSKSVPEDQYKVTLVESSAAGYGKKHLLIQGTKQSPYFFAGTKQIVIETTGDLKDATVTVNNGNPVYYKGAPVTGMSISVQIGGKTLVKDTDYKVKEIIHNNTIGEASITLIGLGDYRDSETTVTFDIVCALKDTTIYMMDENGEPVQITPGTPQLSYAYKDTTLEGSGVRPGISLYLPGGQPIDPGDYLLTYSNCESAGTATVVVSPKNKYLVESRTLRYQIRQTTIEPVTGSTITISYNKDVTYKGIPITTAPSGLNLVIRDSNCMEQELVENTDYVVVYPPEHTKVGQNISFVINARNGNYIGSVVCTFNITAKSIASTATDIVSSIEPIVYTGEGIEPTIKLHQIGECERDLILDTDYEIVGYYDALGSSLQATPKDPGDYQVKVQGKGNYDPNTSRLIPYEIVQKDLTSDVEIKFVNSDNCKCEVDPVTGLPVCVYDGTAHEPEIEVYYNDKNNPLIENEDYKKIVYQGSPGNPAVNAGEATVMITAIGNKFTGSATCNFTIKPKNITDKITTESAINFIGVEKGEEKAYPFTGEPVEPGNDIVITYRPTADDSRSMTLEKDTDYKVSYLSENDELEKQDDPSGALSHSYAGKVTMTVTGIGNYTGSEEFTFYIGEDISQAYATLINSSTTYNGLKQGPKEEDITVIANGAKLDDAGGEKCYNIAYYKNGIEKENEVALEEIVDAATYYVAVIGIPSKGTYAKTPADDCTYTINPKTIANCNVSGFEGMYYYTGNEIRPRDIVVTDTLLPVDESNRNDTRSVQLTAGTDYTVGYTNNISAGKATIIVTGKGNYTGNVYGYFTIDGSNVSGNQNHDGTSEGTGSLSSGTTTISAEDIELYYDNSQYNYMLYNGGHRVPSIRVAGGTINANNFIVTASNDINPGVATLTITGNGNNYTGTIIKNYVIKANLATHGKIVRIEDQVYTGSYVTPNITVTCGNSVLIPGRDYQATYANNVNVGTATVQAQGLASSYYFGTATGTFNISNQAGGMQITGYASNYTYTGYAITPEVIVTMDGRLLNRGTDYQVYYSNNINVGNATMTVTGIGSYSGTKVIPFTIQAKNIENCLTTTVNNYSYNGSTYTPNITVTDSTNGKTLVAGTDYTVTYSNNTDPGTASITVTALSKNYTGSKVIPFKIKSAAVSGLRTSTIKNNSIKLAWTAQSYADGYQICNSNNRVIAMTSKNKYTVKNLKSYTTYKYKVRSYVENSDGSVSYGNFSSAVSAKTLLNTPTLSAKSNSRGKVTLTWSKVSKATGYEIYYSTKRDGIYTKLKTVSKKSARKFVDAGLASGEKYYYTIRAYRKNNGVKTYSSYNTIRAVRVK